MLALEIAFLTDRYHANPWGRNVNEGAAEWPPSPWRLQRALVAAWKLYEPDHNVEPLLQLLAQQPPSLHLPPITQAHTRHYAPVGEQRRLMIDAFTVIEPGQTVAFLWPHLTLAGPEVELLSRLCRGIRYFGRAESWTRVSVSDTAWSIQARPLELHETPSPAGHRLLCPLPDATLAQLTRTTREGRKTSLLRPPGASWIDYHITQPTLPPRPAAPNPTVVVLSLRSATPIPRTQTLAVADALRRRLLALQPASPTLLGKRDGQPRADGHQHLHILPDGPSDQQTLDRVILWAPEGFGPPEQALLAALGSFPWQDASVGLVPWGTHLEARELHTPTTSWVSFTPYLMERHPKRSHDTLEQQLTTDCHRKGLPTPRITPIEPSPPGRYTLRRGPRRPPAGPPHWLRLDFPAPIPGPLCLGASSHFGMGRFVPG